MTVASVTAAVRVSIVSDQLTGKSTSKAVDCLLVAR